jgi:hypothetical protein
MWEDREGGREFQTTQESGPLRGNPGVQVTYRKSSFIAKVELLKARILYLSV